MLKAASVSLVLLSSVPLSFARGESSQALVEKIGLATGICVLLGDEDGALAVQLAQKTDLILYLQHSDDVQVSAVREAAYAAGFLGSRIFVEKGPVGTIHLADNLADAVVLAGGQGPPAKEVLRVLRPKGKFVGPSKVMVKPTPEGMDEWTHIHHAPDNNPASADKVARAPYLTQFLAEPYQCSQPAIGVFAGGRMFKAFGHVASSTPRFAGTINKLMAFNAYNGVKLWERDIPSGIRPPLHAKRIRVRDLPSEGRGFCQGHRRRKTTKGHEPVSYGGCCGGRRLFSVRTRARSQVGLT